MRAFVLTRYGGPDVAELRDMPAPEPERGEVRIDVKAAGLNPVDFKTREGKLRGIGGLPEPTTATKDLHRGAGLATLFWFVSAGSRFHAWRAGVAYRYLFMRPSGKDLEYLASLVDAKKLEVVVDRVFPFASVAEAFAYLEKGRAKGKIVVTMG